MEKESMTKAEAVAQYYDDYTKDYLQCSDLIQVGRFSHDDAEHMRILAERAGMVDAERVLDCGCGVGAMLVAFSRQFPTSTLHGLTISREQSLIGHARVAGNARCAVMRADYLHVPVHDGSYDRVLFVETLGYASDMEAVVAEAARVLRPKGHVYLKEVLVEVRPMSQDDIEELEHYRASWMYNSQPPETLEAMFQRQGFEIVRAEHRYTDELIAPSTVKYRQTRLRDRHPVLRAYPPLTYGDFLFRKR
jgi:ubiquinone/menaquinone biosynthesis C-methylase UbiE